MDEIADHSVIDSVRQATTSTTDDRIDYLRRTRFLQYASDQLVHRLAKEMDMINVSAGSRIVEKGETGDTMYFLVDGVVRVHDGNVELSRLSSGDIFGEIAALSYQRRTASITADTDSLLYTINRDSLYKVINEQPGSARSIIQGLCDNESQFVKEVIHQAVKIRVLERELEIGRRIQKGFLPHAELVIDGWDIESYFKPAHEVAGDFYDYFEIKSLGCMAMVIGDVCDKGVGAALFMTLFRSLIRSSALSFDYAEWKNDDNMQNASPTFADILNYSIRLVNQYVATTHEKDSMFATVFFALLDPKTGEFSYINAGHEAPCLITPDGNIKRLETTGPIVGLFTEAKHDVKSDKISEGEVLLSFTDGISEARNYKNILFGEDKVLQILKSVNTGVKGVVSELVSAVNEFVGSAKQFDDITVLAVERHKGSN